MCRDFAQNIRMKGGRVKQKLKKTAILILDSLLSKMRMPPKVEIYKNCKEIDANSQFGSFWTSELRIAVKKVCLPVSMIMCIFITEEEVVCSNGLCSPIVERPF